MNAPDFIRKWSDVALSERSACQQHFLDPSKRSQLGAHYTSREDIETLVEPVVLCPPPTRSVPDASRRRARAHKTARFARLSCGQTVKSL